MVVIMIQPSVAVLPDDKNLINYTIQVFGSQPDSCPFCFVLFCFAASLHSLLLPINYGIFIHMHWRFVSMIQTDILIVGAGITGTALARELSRYQASVTVIERGYDVAEGATKANSGIVHAGYDAMPGTLKARYNVLGAEMYPALCEQLFVPYRRCGALVIGFSEADRSILEQLLQRGEQNGVSGMEMISGEEALKLEPSLNPETIAALKVPSSGIVSPYELAFALADDAAANGVSFVFGQEISSAEPDKQGCWKIGISRGETYCCKAFVNCSGASGAFIHNMISDEKLKMTHRRGQYYLLDHAQKPAFCRTIFQCPTAMGKGVLVSPTVHGNLLIGPNAEDIPDPLDTATTSAGLEAVLSTARRTWPALSVRTNITNFSGVRAHLDTDDFQIGAVHGVRGAFEAIGIESPGLSSAPAIAESLSSCIAEFLNLKKKNSLVPFRKPLKPFSEMSDSERASAVLSNPEYGNIICRCEVVTEAEIRQSIRRPVGARTIDGVKRRTRAGMGRCQGGFCCPRVAEILSEELSIPLTEVTKNGGNSYLLTGSVESMLKGGKNR